MERKSRKKYFENVILPVAIIVVIFFAGCKSVSPTKVATDRMDYSQVIAESWKQQTLLNIIRLRYADAPVFLEITSIINSQSVGGNLLAGGGFPAASPSGIDFSFGGSKSWSNTPTISYQPVMGDKFTKSLLQPIPPESVFQLIQGGWPPELVLRTIVFSINGLRNASGGVAADSAFIELKDLISAIQRSGGLGLRVESLNSVNKVEIVLPQGPEGDPLNPQRERIRELLKLEKNISEFQVQFGLIPMNNHEVAMVTRSVLDLMIQIGFGIDIPPSHLAEGRVLPGYLKPGDKHARVLTHICSGPTKPPDACVSVQYKDYWFWIEDTDAQSKQLFTFLMILFSLAETGQTFSTPVVTVPSR